MRAFEELVHRYDKQVLGIAAQYVVSADDAKDIYQEVFVRVYRSLGKFEFRSEFATWLHRITVNVCLTHKTRRNSHPLVSLNEQEAGHGEQSSRQLRSPDPSPHELGVASEISSRVQRAVESLAPKQRMVFTLKHYEGYKLREIAVMMQCTEGTVKRYLFLATQRLRQQLREFYE